MRIFTIPQSDLVRVWLVFLFQIFLMLLDIPHSLGCFLTTRADELECLALIMEHTLRITSKFCTEGQILQQLVLRGDIALLVAIANALLNYEEVEAPKTTADSKPVFAFGDAQEVKGSEAAAVANSESVGAAVKRDHVKVDPKSAPRFRCSRRAYAVLCSWLAATFAKIVTFDQNFDVSRYFLFLLARWVAETRFGLCLT